MLKDPISSATSVAITVAILVVSCMLHEIAHGFVAYLLGDDTAKRAHRLTLNPLAHIDPFGSVILPCLMSLAHGPIFGFAKPVPYNPRRLKGGRLSEVLVALAGPLSNVLQACVALGIVRVLFATNGFKSMPFQQDITTTIFVYKILMQYMVVNISLAAFNLIPLPSLDGSSLLGLFLSGKLRQTYEYIQHYSLPILMMVLYVLPSILHFDIISWYVTTVIHFAMEFMLQGL